MKPLICVVDIEATCWDDPEPGPGGATVADPVSEIIEIGAVMARTSDLAEVSSFGYVVRPVINPQLSDFCRNLTKISQEDVDQARLFPWVCAALWSWLEDHGGPLKILFASWGRYDLAQLTRDCGHHGLKFPFDAEHLNLKNETAKAMGRKPRGLGRALGLMNLKFEGEPHRGLTDARNALRTIRGSGLKIENADVVAKKYNQVWRK